MPLESDVSQLVFWKFMPCLSFIYMLTCVFTHALSTKCSKCTWNNGMAAGRWSIIKRVTERYAILLKCTMLK